MNKEAFKIDAQELEACRKEVKVEVPLKEINAAFEKTIISVKGQVNLPGFRAGKAPKALVAKRYSAEIEDQIKQDIFRSTMEVLFDDKDLKPVTQPEVKQGDIVRNADFTFTLTYDVSPSFETPTYKELALEVEEYKADEEAVEKELETVCDRFATLQLVERSAEEEDFVKGTYTSTYEAPEGEEIPESAAGVLNGESRWIPVKEQSLLPDVLAAFKGSKVGEEVKWTATFAADYPIEYLQGKAVDYTCKVEEVHGRVIPELNDELAVKAGAESVEDLKTKISEGSKAQFEAEQVNKNKEIVLEKLLEGFDCALPPTLLESEIERALHSLKHEKGVDHDCDHVHTDSCDHTEEENAKEAELKAEATEKATKEIKTRFLIGEIADIEDVKVDDYEVQYQIYMMAQQFKVDPKVFAEQLKNNGSIDEFRDQILVDKTLGKIVELNTKKDK
ncbi:MAG: trigger factor [Lentisphaeraceae bacterium]|nr:trigger factor [Lentisphaeraceae bacterium]